eukprot:SAG31_NODE_10835_length_1092_cov_1.308157_1_plen_142_part_01
MQDQPTPGADADADAVVAQHAAVSALALKLQGLSSGSEDDEQGQGEADEIQKLVTGTEQTTPSLAPTWREVGGGAGPSATTMKVPLPSKLEETETRIAKIRRYSGGEMPNDEWTEEFAEMKLDRYLGEGGCKMVRRAYQRPL